ncbi:hypothetical protein LTR53_008132 [Teratosphaeriaceae sp. CCFEE 6253]|nr:hypothetical protein LTR53_008132 [Teratosphaeriaceae sp. CCFEE 6253]
MAPSVISGRVQKLIDASKARAGGAAISTAKIALPPVKITNYHGIQRTSLRDMKKPDDFKDSSDKQWCKHHGETSGTGVHKSVGCKVIANEKLMAEGKELCDLPHPEVLKEWVDKKIAARKSHNAREAKQRQGIHNMNAFMGILGGGRGGRGRGR